MSQKILVIGAQGQIGSVLTESLKKLHGTHNVVATDIRAPQQYEGVFEILDVTDVSALESCISRHSITQIYHLAAILSAKGESIPIKAWEFNMGTFFNVMEASKKFNIEKVFFPSSIAAFGPSTPQENTPQFTVMIPETVYGISKSCAEDWCQYYFMKFGIDVRSLRYPGIIGYQSLPGGGTTDYAVDIYHKAVNGEDFSCFLESTATLPMIYMEDAIRATIQLMEAPKENVKIRTSYNLAGMSFSPAEIYDSIKKLYPDFNIKYEPDFRQAIAASWPKSIDDSSAKEDWGWKPKYDLHSMTKDMLYQLELQYGKKSANQFA